MHTTRFRIVVSLLAFIVAFGIARANAEPTPMDDAARQSERYVIQPGAEQLVSDMLGMGQTVAAGCTLSEGNIERTSVVATYVCGEQRVVLQLVHPSLAPASAIRTERFAITVRSGTPPEGFLDAVADRIRAHEAAFEWTEVADREPTLRRRGPLPIAGGAVAVIVALWILRRLAARRRRSNTSTGDAR